jgi:taurine dioxygenase
MLTLDGIGPRRLDRVAGGRATPPYRRFGVRPLAPTIGAEIDGVDLAEPLDDELFAELQRALLEWKVLFFRDQSLTRQGQAAFASRWGTLENHPFFGHLETTPDQPADAPEVVRFAKSEAAGGFENLWHADVTWRATPALGAVLRAVEVPEVGGDTLWADMAAAYDNLPEDLQARIDGLDAEHDWVPSFGLGMDEATRDRLRGAFPPVVHPVVATHPRTGRRTLFVNRIFTTRILGVEPDESDALLARLCAQADVPEYQCRFRWTPGAVAFWDNHATQHYAASDYYPARRVMERVSIVGTRPQR